VSEWKLVLDEDALTALLSCRSAERKFLLASLASLRDNPYQSGDFEERDDTDRPLQVKLFRQFLITSWADHSSKEMRVLAIERVRVR
jgi:hypothetical protein